MGKRKYAVHKDAGKTSREHNEKVLSAITDILKQEARDNECYSDGDLSEMVCGVGLLCHKGMVYDLRLRHEIPNSRDRKILNFAKRHKNKS